MTPDPPILHQNRNNKPPSPINFWFVIGPLFCLFVVAFLIIGGVPSFHSGEDPKYRQHGTIADLINLSLVIDSFYVDTHRYPTTAEGLAALLTKPDNAEGWQGPYMDKIPRDKWGNDYIYRYPSPTNPTTYDLHSRGEDGIDGTPDDLTKDSN
jgi:general secretion pathway protein G